jgi:uncharacterized SAM-binding protein YcdF (DUF218 family)
MVRCVMSERKSTIVSAVTGAIFILYYCVISFIEREPGLGFALIWPITGVALVLCAANMRLVMRGISRLFSRPPFSLRATQIALSAFAAVFLAISLVFFAGIVSSPREPSREPSLKPSLKSPTREVEYLIVLGGGAHKDGTTSLTLTYRLAAAASFAREHPDVKIIVTGGKIPRNKESEADSMARWLVQNGKIDVSRILLERKALDTIQNFSFSLALIGNPANKPAIAVVTSDSHMNRSLFLARQSGLTDVIPCPAPTPAIMVPANYLRETGAWWKLAIRLVVSGKASAIGDLVF